MYWHDINGKETFEVASTSTAFWSYNRKFSLHLQPTKEVILKNLLSYYLYHLVIVNFYQLGHSVNKLLIS